MKWLVSLRNTNLSYNGLSNSFKDIFASFLYHVFIANSNGWLIASILQTSIKFYIGKTNLASFSVLVAFLVLKSDGILNNGDIQDIFQLTVTCSKAAVETLD